MITFILNDSDIHTEHSPGMTLLDFIRYERRLTGTKCGCREGDCGACTVLIGEKASSGEMKYQTATSCLCPLANIAGKHVVTIEGINPPEGGLTPVQQALVDENGTQCGFCTPGFVMSLTGYLLNQTDKGVSPSAKAAIDGNICRCTGYKSIERAAITLIDLRGQAESSPAYAIRHRVVPAYFSGIPARLAALRLPDRAIGTAQVPDKGPYIGGGTDLYVQRPEEMCHSGLAPLSGDPALKGIRRLGDEVEIGALTTVTEWMESPLLQACFPMQESYLRLVSSTPIRHMATVGGNLINASPIGDLTIWLLALDAQIVLQRTSQRVVPLRAFYIGYKQMDLMPGEIAVAVRFRRPEGRYFFHFEKVCKRKYLDIAAVNTAIFLRIEGDTIVEAHLSAGGIAPVPLYLGATAARLTGQSIVHSEDPFREVAMCIDGEISPISDVRGSATYKRLLLKQLFKAHHQAVQAWISKT